MIEELVIALDLPADSENPVLLPEVYSTGHSLGEYMFYAAADKAAVDELNQIDENTMKINFTVDVNFRSDTREVALADIKDVKGRFARHNKKYEEIREKTQMHGPSSLLEARGTNLVLLPIDAGENWASRIYGDRFMEQATLRVSFKAVEGDRTLTIEAYAVSDDYTLEEIIEHWQTLVDKYRNIPIDVFTGPPVESV